MYYSEWSSDMLIQLLREYKKYPELWNQKHDLYRVYTAKYDAWAALSEKFDCDVAELRRKMNSMYASHRRERVKIRNGGFTNWMFYNELSFLPNHVVPNEPPQMPVPQTQPEPMNQSIKSDQIVLSDDEENCSREDCGLGEASGQIVQGVHVEDGGQVEDCGQAEDYASLEAVVVKTESKTDERTRPTLRRRQHELSPTKARSLLKRKAPGQRESKLLETLKLFKKSEVHKKKDECDSFGEYIADSLRKHDERTRSMIKQAINNILFEQEMKKYNTPNQYTVILGEPEANSLVLVDPNDK